MRECKPDEKCSVGRSLQGALPFLWCTYVRTYVATPSMASCHMHTCLLNWQVLPTCLHTQAGEHVGSK